MGKRSQFKSELVWQLYYNREKLRNKIIAKIKYDINRQHGTCTKCGTKCEINPNTNKPYHECFKHRLMESVRYGRNLETTK